MATTVAGRIVFALWIAAFSISAAAVDNWDAAAINDNTAATTRNELSRGEWQEHDLEAVGGVADDDWFVIPVTRERTYQLVINQITGDTPIDNADFMRLFAADGTTPVGAIPTAGSGLTSRVIRWSSGDQTSFRLRVRGTSGLTSAAKYMVQYVESTLYCPRYNNTDSQFTLVIIQNLNRSACSAVVRFFREDGAFVGEKAVNVPLDGTSIVAASSAPNVDGTKGSVQINAEFCSPSVFKAKAVSLQPSTGFTFDTLCERR